MRSICIALTSSCDSSTNSVSLDPVRVSDGRVLYCWLMRFRRLLLHAALACENQLQLNPSPATPAFSFSPNAHFQITYAVLHSPHVLRFIPTSTPPLSRLTFLMSPAIFVLDSHTAFSFLNWSLRHATHLVRLQVGTETDLLELAEEVVKRDPNFYNTIGDACACCKAPHIKYHSSGQQIRIRAIACNGRCSL